MNKGKNRFLSFILITMIIIASISAFEIQDKAAKNILAAENMEEVSTLSNLQVKDYYKYTGKYFIYFNEASESLGYNVYVDDVKNPVKKIYSSGEYLSDKDLEGLKSGDHMLYVANIGSNEEESPKISTKFTIVGKTGTYTNIPQIYIYSTGSISSEYHEKADVSVSIIDKDGGTNKDLYDSGCNIKIRGNTTAGAPKKPWNIKLSGKKSVLGMGKGKKWCLLANSFDKSLMRNNLAYDLGLQNGVTYTSESRFVEVYVNGKYQGNYLITEAVEVKKERVDINAYDADSNDILLELGTRNEAGVDHFRTGTLSMTFDVNDPEKGDDLTDEQVDAKISRVRSYLTQFERALVKKDYDVILQYIDEDTFINFYIVSELFKNVDFNFSSTRFYIKDDKIYAGPLWDFDLSSGNCKSSYYKDYYIDGVSYKGFYCQEMDWYKYLLKNNRFYEKLKQRYKKLQYVIQNMYKNESETTLSIDYLVNTYGESFKRNYMSTNALGAGWSLTNDDGYSYSAQSGWTTWEQPIAFLRNWLKNRNIWLCEQWEIDMESAYENSRPGVEEPSETMTEPQETTTKAEIATTLDISTKVEIPTTLTVSTKQEIVTSAKTVEPVTTTKKLKVKLRKTKIKKAFKRQDSKKMKISLKTIKIATGYQIQISKSKSFRKKKILVKKSAKKVKFAIKSDKIKKKGTLYVRARVYKRINGKKNYSKWSKARKITIKK